MTDVRLRVNENGRIVLPRLCPGLKQRRRRDSLLGGTPRNEISSGDLLVESRENRPVGARKVYQVAVSSLLWSLHPRGKTRDVMAVGDKRER